MHRTTSLAALALTLVIAAFGPCCQRTEAEAAPQKAVTFDAEARSRVELYPDDQALGGEAPLVTVVVFGGYACPPCARSWRVMEHLVEDYGDDLRVVFRALTIPGFTTGEQAVEAALSAGSQGRFWPMHRRLYAVGDPAKFDRAGFSALARELGLDLARFDDDLDTGVHAAVRMRHRRQAISLGLEVGPVALVNGRPIVGFHPEDEWHALIDAEIAEARKKLAAGVPRAELYASFMADAEEGQVVFREEIAAAYKELRKRDDDAPLILEEANPEVRYQVTDEGAPTRGPDDAPALLVAFMDPECPFSKRSQREVLDPLLERYPHDLRLAIRHLPLPIHPSASGIARALVAAQRQDKFWPFYAQVMAAEPGSLGRADFLRFADEAGIERTKFLADLDARDSAEAVREDALLGKRLGVGGTPGFFLNGRYLTGYQSIDHLSQRIDEELTAAAEREAQGVPRAELVRRLLEEATPPSQFPNATL